MQFVTFKIIWSKHIINIFLILISAKGLVPGCIVNLCDKYIDYA